jgi:hypothetical protein
MTELDPAAKIAVIGTVAVVGRKKASARPVITAIVGAADYVVAVAIRQTIHAA